MNDQQLLATLGTADPLGSRVLPPPEPLLDRVLAAARSESISRPRQLRSPRFAPIGVVAVVLALAAPAFGFGLTRLLNGTPAPPAVTNELTPGNNGQPPTASTEVQLTTSQGYTATLYATHLDGRDCGYVRVTDGSGSPAERGIALCPLPSPGSTIDFATSGALEMNGSWVKFLYGHLASNVASAAVQFGDGHETALPISDGYFLHEVVPGETEPMTLTARSSTGEQIAQQLFPSIRTAP
jgi:hypothetical protein